MGDKRGYKVVVVPDYILNPSNHPEYPQTYMAYDIIRKLGYGVVKLPPHEVPEELAEPWIEAAADMIEEYLKKGYEVKVIGVRDLPDMGIWLTKLLSELKDRGIPDLRLLAFSIDGLKDLKSLLLSSSLK